MTDGTIRAAGDGWEPALAAALLGAERAPPAAAGSGPLADLVGGTDPGGTDPGGALLAQLALHATLHRAGIGLGPEALAPAEPRAAFGPECPPAAATRLYGFLVGGYAARARLEEWCEIAAAGGLRAPVWLLQALAARRAELPEAIDRIAGPELAWLAAVSGEAPAEGAAEGAAEAGADGSADWSEGTAGERRAAFTAFRARDPEAARAALEAGFRKEKADLREALVNALATGLSEADEPFLETCLDDRATGVRLAAQRLLPLLPGSRYAARMAERARAALTVESKRRLLGGTTHALAVALPEESPALARDGVEANAWDTRNGGARAALLRGILARAPLSAFADHPPRLWIALALGSEWSEPVFNGLYSAVQRTRDPDWTEAMAEVLAEAYAEKIRGVRRTDQLLALWAQALDLLPDAAWESRVAELIRARRIELVLAMLARGPERFSESFSAALLDWLAFVSRGSDSLRQALAKGWIVERLGERLWPSADAAASAAAILARLGEAEGGRLRNQLATLVETLELRAAMRRDFESETGTGEGAQG
jgi:hypothetical protein